MKQDKLPFTCRERATTPGVTGLESCWYPKKADVKSEDGRPRLTAAGGSALATAPRLSGPNKDDTVENAKPRERVRTEWEADHVKHDAGRVVSEMRRKLVKPSDSHVCKALC